MTVVKPETAAAVMVCAERQAFEEIVARRETPSKLHVVRAALSVKEYVGDGILRGALAVLRLTSADLATSRAPTKRAAAASSSLGSREDLNRFTGRPGDNGLAEFDDPHAGDKRPREADLTVAQKKLLKVNTTGMKSISSFFKK
jgi:hypothetical protein